MKVSENFDSSEFTCKCGECDGGGVKWLLIRNLETLREVVGRPIKVTSGYRCSEHNRKVGGVTDSFHTKGLAADIVCEGLSTDELAAKASKVFNLGGVGYYPKEGFVHVDVRGARARWTKQGGKYEAWTLG